MPRPPIPARVTRLLDRLGPLLALVAVWIIFAVKEPRTFPTFANAQSILLQTAVVGIAALGATMIIISGGIDLSVGSLIALVSVVVALVLNAAMQADAASAFSPNSAATLATLAGVATAAACGLAIGSMVIGRLGRVIAAGVGAIAGLIAYHQGLNPWLAAPLAVAVFATLWWIDRRLNILTPLSPFIVTLGMWGALRGAAKGLAGNQSIYTDHTRLNDFMQLPQVEINAALIARPWLWWSPGVWIFLALTLLVGAVLRYTQFGRHLFAVGSNEQTARLCGINVDATKVKVYTLAGILAGVAGVLQYSYVTLGDPTTAPGYELKAIAAVVIGGASLSGGVGTVLGTIAGALMMGIIDNGCTKIGVEVWVQEILTGAIIVAAVAIDKLRHRTPR